MNLEEAVNNVLQEDGTQISEEFRNKCIEFLNKYAEIEKAEAEIKTIKKDLEEYFRVSVNLTSIDFPEYNYQVQGRNNNKITWDEKRIFNLLGATPYALTVFPKSINKNLLSDEDIKQAGLLEKCTTRNFDPKAMEDLIAKEVYKLDDFVGEGLMSVELGKTIARVKLPKEKKKTSKK